LLPGRYEQPGMSSLSAACRLGGGACIRCAAPRAESRAEHCSGVESGGGGGAAGMATGSGEGVGGGRGNCCCCFNNSCTAPLPQTLLDYDTSDLALLIFSAAVEEIPLM
jgi:hypothetical protein